MSFDRPAPFPDPPVRIDIAVACGCTGGLVPDEGWQPAFVGQTRIDQYPGDGYTVCGQCDGDRWYWQGAEDGDGWTVVPT